MPNLATLIRVSALGQANRSSSSLTSFAGSAPGRATPPATPRFPAHESS